MFYLVYVETGNQGTTGATLAIALGTATVGGSHKIKVSFIECSSRSKAPTGCVQYFTGTSGSVSSYNHLGGNLLSNQWYSVCFRQELGYCSVDFREASAANDAFSIDTGITTGSEITCTAADGYISIPNDYSTTSNMRCGGNLNAEDANTTPGVYSHARTTPFIMQVFTLLNTDDAAATDDATGTGFALDYSQVPC